MTTSTNKLISKEKTSSKKRKMSDDNTLPFPTRFSLAEEEAMDKISPQSMKTINFHINPIIIEKYKEESIKTRSATEKMIVNQILNEVSLKEKNAPFFESETECQLTPNIKKLIDKSFAFDQYLFNLKKKSRFLLLEELEENWQINKTLPSTVELKQILFLNPDHYEILRKERNLIIINLPMGIDQSNLKEFFQNRKNKLIDCSADFIKKEYYLFLKSRDKESDFFISQSYFDSEFDTNNIIVPQRELFWVGSKGKGSVDKGKISIMKKEIGDLEEERTIKKMLIDMVQVKERKLEKLKRIKFRNEKNKLFSKDILKKISQSIQKYFNLRGVSAVFYVSLIDHLYSLYLNTMSQLQIKEILDKIIIILPRWLNIIEHELGRIVQINLVMVATEVLEEINKKL